MSGHPSTPSLPSRELARQQSEWFRGARTRLFRQVNLARCEHILELGAGWGDVSAELADRSGAQVTALDQCDFALQTIDHPRVHALHADAHHIPLPKDSMDLVVTQFAFLWFRDPATVIREIQRVLKSNGAVACIEPDFGGLIEYPPELETRDIWIAALERQAANPLIGRALPVLFSDAGFRVDTYLQDQTVQPSFSRFELLRELDLTQTENHQLTLAAKTSTEQSHQTAHLPVFLLAIRHI